MTAVMRLTGISKQVFECVPVLTAQQAHTIALDVKKRGGPAESKVVAAHLDDLAELGLIKRVGADRYQRQLQQATPPDAAAQPGQPGQNDSAQDMLVQVARELRDCASHFASRVKLLADRLDTIAEQHCSAESEAVSKLRQLQSLLKGL